MTGSGNETTWRPTSPCIADNHHVHFELPEEITGEAIGTGGYELRKAFYRMVLYERAPDRMRKTVSTTDLVTRVVRRYLSRIASGYYTVHGVLAGALRGKRLGDPAMLWHASQDGDSALCGKVKPGHLADIYGTPDNQALTCAACVKKVRTLNLTRSPESQ